MNPGYLEHIISSIQAGTWEWNLKTGQVHLNEHWQTMLGNTDAPLEITVSEWEKLLHPDDHAITIKAVYDHIAGKTDIFQAEFRLRHRSGNWVWIRSRGSITANDKNGSPLFFCGIHIDVTDQKHAEAQRIASEKQYKKIFENLRDVYAEIDVVTGHIREISPSILSVGGYTRDEMLGTAINKYFVDQEAALTMFKLIRFKGSINDYETILRDKSGRERTVSFTAIYEHGDSEGIFPSIIGTMRPIDERKAMENRLAASEKKFRLIAENSSDGLLVLNAENTIEYISPFYIKQLGYPAEHFSPKTYDNIYNLMHPEDWRVVLLLRKAVCKREESIRYSYRIRNSIGKYIWLEDSARFSYGHSGNHEKTYIISRDITHMKLHEEEMQLLKQAIEHNPTTVMITNERGDIEYVNPSFTELTGYSSQEVIGRNPRFLRSGTHKSAFYENLWQTIQDGKVWQNVLCNRKKNGTLYWEKQFISSLKDQDGHILHYISVKYDITEQVRSEKLIRENIKMKDNFISTISHELRTPLFSILGFTSILRKENLSPEHSRQSEFLEIIHEEALRLSALIENVLSISCIDAGKAFYNKTDTDLGKITSSVIANLTRQANEKDISFSVDLPSSALRIHADQGAMKQVVINLVGNAIKFTKHGGTVRLSLQQSGESDILIIVEDNGIGIPEDAIPHIFEKFYRVERKGYEIQGTGLGLAIVNQIVTAHGGKVQVSSEPYNKTTFTVMLPGNTE